MNPTHACPGGCGRQVPHHHLACGPCWERLPATLAIAISATYRNRLAEPAAHRAALQDAIGWYRDNPRKDVQPA